MNCENSNLVIRAEEPETFNLAESIILHNLIRMLGTLGTQ